MVFFLLALPLNILLSSLATSNTALVCVPELVRSRGGMPEGALGGSSAASSSSSSSSSGGSYSAGIQSAGSDGFGDGATTSSSSANRGEKEAQPGIAEPSPDFRLSSEAPTGSASTRQGEGASEGDGAKGGGASRSSAGGEGSAAQDQESIESSGSIAERRTDAAGTAGSAGDEQQGPGIRDAVQAGFQEVRDSLPQALAIVRRVW